MHIKGTSRLISTDSEGISGSPPYLSPVQQIVSSSHPNSTTVNYSAAAASLVAVLSDELSPQPTALTELNPTNTNPSVIANCEQNINIKTKKEKSKPKAEPIKLKIKTSARALRNTADQLEQPIGEIESHRGSRSTRRNQTIDDNTNVGSIYENTFTSNTQPSDQHSLNDAQFSEATVSDIRKLPSNQQLSNPTTVDSDVQGVSDSERGVVPKKRRPRNKAKFEPESIEPVVEEPVQKKQRGRRRNDDNLAESSEALISESINLHSDYLEHRGIQITEPDTAPKKRMTAAARKQYSLPIQSLPVAAPILEIEKPTESEQANEEPVNNSPKGRNKRTKSKKINNLDIPSVSMPQEEKSVRATRATRQNANGSTMQV